MKDWWIFWFHCRCGYKIKVFWHLLMLTASCCRLSSKIYDSICFECLNYSYSWIYKSALSALFFLFILFPLFKISQLFSHHGAIFGCFCWVNLPSTHLTLAIHALQVLQLLSTHFGLVTSASLITYPILTIYSLVSLRRKSLESWYQYSIRVDILIIFLKTQQ